jgi:hypothetical protein
MSLLDARLVAIHGDIHRARIEVLAFRDILKTCMIGVRIPAAHEHALLRMTAELHPKLHSMRLRLEGLRSEVPELSRHTPRGDSASAHGHLGNIRGNLRLLQQELAQCERELREASAEVSARLNDPLRTPSLPSGNPIEILDLALALITMVLHKWKQRN